jgi:uncharacterized phiE125 gp8 family phage protein
MRLSLLNGPAIEPVSLSETKQWLRIDENDEDDLLAALNVSARLTIEAYTRRSLLTQNWRMTLDAWPQSSKCRAPLAISIPFAPFRQISAVRVFDKTDVAQIVAPNSYHAPAADDRARLTFTSQPPAPGRRNDGIEIDVVAGYGDNASDVPEPLRRAILMLVAQWHEHRGDTQTSNDAMPLAVKALAAPYRRERLT